MRELTYPVLKYTPTFIRGDIKSEKDLLVVGEIQWERGCFTNSVIIDSDGRKYNVLSSKRLRRTFDPWGIFKEYRAIWVSIELSEPEQLTLDQVRDEVLGVLLAHPEWYRPYHETERSLRARFVEYQTIEELVAKISIWSSPTPSTQEIANKRQRSRRQIREATEQQSGEGEKERTKELHYPVLMYTDKYLQGTLTSPSWVFMVGENEWRAGRFDGAVIIDAAGNKFRVLSSRKERPTRNPLHFLKNDRPIWVSLELSDPEHLTLEDVREEMTSLILNHPEWYGGFPDETREDLEDFFGQAESIDELIRMIDLYD